MAAPSIASASDATPEVVRLEYTASAGCPDREAFERQISARTSRARFEDGAQARRLFRVHVDAGPPATGSVTVEQDRAAGRSRGVSGDTCADVANALALVVALAVDPRALEGGGAAAPVPAPVPESVPAPVPESAPAPESAPVPAPESAPAPEPEPAPESSPSRPFSLGADLALATNTTPIPLIGPAPFFAWQSPGSTIAARVGVSVVRATTGIVDMTGGSGSFVWTVGHVDGCAAFLPHGPARLFACARVEAGDLDAEGVSVAAPQKQSRAWFAAGPLFRTEWSVARPLFLDLELAAMFRPVAFRFYFLPDTTAYRMPMLGLYASGGVGVYFP
jgi:hypothetical protein